MVVASRVVYIYKLSLRVPNKPFKYLLRRSLLVWWGGEYIPPYPDQIDYARLSVHTSTPKLSYPHTTRVGRVALLRRGS